ncbi:MAG: hypothetical protein ACO1OD_14490 [Croceibacterium sp.]
MRETRTSGLLAVTLILAACGGEEETPEEPAPTPPGAATSDASPDPVVADWAARSWDLQASGEGTALVFPTGGDTQVRLFCPAGGETILVNVPGFRPVGSEERMTFGSGGEAHTLVADTRGDRQRGGVSGTGAVPGNLAALLGGPVSVNHGSQNAGPYPAPPAGLVRSFVTACNDGAATPSPTPTAKPTPKPSGVSACLVQGDQRLSNPPLRAVGTEPFWGARIEGRCVTYSHPEDQQGTRVWTRYTPGAGGGGTWRGALEGKPFVLTARPEAGCSDGMSDNRYPYAVELLVNGERRTGCAERR